MVITMEQNGKVHTNGLTHGNGFKNGINGHGKNGYHGNNGFMTHCTEGLNGYNHHKNGHSHGGNGYIHGTNGYSKGMNGYNGYNHDIREYNNNNNNNKNYYIPGDIVSPVLLERLLTRTRQRTCNRLKIIIAVSVMTSHALISSILSYKPAFKTVAPMAVTMCTDLISLGLAVAGMLWYNCNMNAERLRNQLYKHLCQRPKDTLMSAVTILVTPALDQLQHMALRDVGTRSFKIVNHVGVITTLIACFYTFGRKPRPLQVWSIIIFVGCTQLMEYSNCPPNEEFIASHKLAKYIWVTVSWACIVLKMVLSSSYIVYLEYFIRCDRKVSIWVRIVQIGFWKMVTDVARLLYIDGAYIQENGFFSGFNSLVWLYVLFRSFSVILGFLSILYFDSVGKTLQQTGGILLGMQISSILLSNYFCLFSFLSCIAAIVATIAYLQWNGHGKDVTKTQSEVVSPNNAWEIWYLDTMNGDVITLLAHGALTYICVWCLILFSVGEKVQSLLLKSMTPFLVGILFNVMLCFRLRVTSSTFVFRSSVFVCVLSLAAYLTLITIKLDLHFYLIIM